MAVTVNTTERRVSVQVKRAKDGKDFNFDELTESQKDEFRWDLSQLQSDGTFYKDVDFIRANISTYPQEFNYEGSQEFKLDFIPTNFMFVQKVDSEGRIYDVEYSWNTEDILTIGTPLSIGDKIKILYEHFITQP